MRQMFEIRRRSRQERGRRFTVLDIGRSRCRSISIRPRPGRRSGQHGWLPAIGSVVPPRKRASPANSVLRRGGAHGFERGRVFRMNDRATVRAHRGEVEAGIVRPAVVDVLVCGFAAGGDPDHLRHRIRQRTVTRLAVCQRVCVRLRSSTSVSVSIQRRSASAPPGKTVVRERNQRYVPSRPRKRNSY